MKQKMATVKNVRKIDRERRRASRKRIINADILKVSVFFALLFLAMIISLGVFITRDSGTVINNTYNKRSQSIKKAVQRGTIYSANGDILAYSEIDEDGNEERIYPYGSTFAHVVGFESNGGLGIEASYNYYLLTSHVNVFQHIANEFNSVKQPGDSLITTLDTGIQEKLEEILGWAEGAIVVLNPKTGEILGMYSNPGFDPNTIDEIWDEISSDNENSVLVNRAASATYTPGSTFKLFTLLEFYRETDGGAADFEYECQGSVTVSGSTVSCHDGEVHGWENINDAFANSCNAAFTEIGLSLDLDSFRTNNEALFFNSEMPLDIEYKSSSFTLDADSSDFMVMQTSFGQGQTLVSPIHLALITAAIANDGVLMKPHLVSEIIDWQGNSVSKIENTEYARLLTSDEAQFMRENMRAVVTEGTGIILSYDGNYISYGKTGTAETSSDEENNYDHSWFTGFAENDGTSIVVCAMIENSQESGLTGVWAVKQVFDYYFN